MKRKSRILGILIVALAVVAAGCSKAPAAESAAADDAKKPTVTVEEVKVGTRSIRDTVELTGSFSASQGSVAKLTAAVPGRLRKVMVKEGDQVAKGQLLATLDTSVQQSQQTSAQAALQAAQAQASQSVLTYQAAAADQLANVRTSEIALDQARLQRQSDVDQAELAYQGAKADLAKIRAGARPQELAQAHEATVQAQVALNRAASEFSRDTELSKDGYVSRRQLEDAKTALETAQSAFTSAQASESLVRAGARPEDVRAAEMRAAAARAALASAQALGDKRIAAATSALKQARAAALTVSAKQRDVVTNQALAKQRAADALTAAATTGLSEIRAPYAGKISRRQLNSGDFADTTTPVLEISASGGALDFVASALPTQAASVHPGMEAEITAGDASFTGRVTSVSSPDPQSGLVSIRIASGAATSYAGTFGTVKIVLATLRNVVATPDATLLNHDGKTSVFRDIEGTAKLTEVTTGPEDGGFTAIKSGLKAGERVVQLGGYELDDGAKITVAEKPKADAGEKEPAP